MTLFILIAINAGALVLLFVLFIVGQCLLMPVPDKRNVYKGMGSVYNKDGRLWLYFDGHFYDLTDVPKVKKL